MRTANDAEMARDREGWAHVVALSGGKDSTAMALRLREIEPGRPFTFVCTPTGAELPEMFDHFKRLRELLAPDQFLPLTHETLDGLVRKFNAVPNWRMRWCTRLLKVEPFKAFVLTQRPVVIYVGLRADEEARKGIIYGEIEGVEERLPLQEWGWGKREVYAYLQKRSIEVPYRTDCGQCFFQTLAEWWHLWDRYPDLYRKYEIQEDTTGHTYRSPQRDSWPAALGELRQRFERGEMPRGANRQLDIFGQRPAFHRHCRVCSL